MSGNPDPKSFAKSAPNRNPADTPALENSAPNRPAAGGSATDGAPPTQPSFEAVPSGDASPGALIAAARSRRGLSLDDLAERTKIPTAMLRALEADEYHRLSGPLYSRSFLRTCAKELELPVDEILENFARCSGEVTRPAGGPPRVEEAVRIRRVGLPWGRLAVGATVVAAVATLAVVLTRPGGRETVPDPATSGAAAEQAAATPETAWIADGGPMAVPRGEAPAGRPGMAFSDGLTWPMVVRLRVPGPVAARARRDANEQYAEVVWPGATPASPVPESGVETGRAYADGGGLVVYWGAVGRLHLVLGSGEGAEVTVNGVARALELPVGGGEVVLDLQAAPAAPPR